MHNVKAVILAAGCGTRLHPITENKPKCMTKVASRPILQHQIEALSQAGIRDIIVVVGYKGQVISDFLRQYDSEIRVRIIHNPDFARTNNMFSLWLTGETIGSECHLILCNGDVVFDRSVVARLLGSSPDRIVCEEGAYNDESMKISVNRDGNITDISKAIPQAAAFGCSIDLYFFSRKSVAILFEEVGQIIEGQGRLNEWTEVGLQRLLRRGSLSMTPFVLENENWVEIDNLEDLVRADLLFSGLPERLKVKRLFFIDLDGTVYLGDQGIPGADAFISRLKAMGASYYLISNNSSKSKKDYVNKLRGMGIEVGEDHIVLSSDGVKEFLRQKGAKKLFLVASGSMCDDFRKGGFEIDAREPEYVVLGYDTEIHYEKIRRAALHLNHGVPFIATHGDVVCPTPDGPIPDIGAMTAMFEKATGTKARVFGKPMPAMIEHKIEALGLDRSEVVVIGDRLYTDMVLARNCGVDFVCVLSGETKRQDIEECQDPPLFISASLADLARILESIEHAAGMAAS